MNGGLCLPITFPTDGGDCSTQVAGVQPFLGGGFLSTTQPGVALRGYAASLTPGYDVERLRRWVPIAGKCRRHPGPQDTSRPVDHRGRFYSWADGQLVDASKLRIGHGAKLRLAGVWTVGVDPGDQAAEVERVGLHFVVLAVAGQFDQPATQREIPHRPQGSVNR